MRLLFVVLSFLSVISAATIINSAWENHVDLPIGISDAHAINVNNVVYLAGGCIAPFQSTNSYEFPCNNVTGNMWMLTEGATSWTPLPSMPHPRFRYAIAAVGNLIYYVGGRVYINESMSHNDVVVSEVDVFDTVDKKWSTLSAQNCNCTSISDAAAFVIGNKLYVTGGYVSDYTTILNSTIVLNTSRPLLQQQFQTDVVAQRNWATGDLGAVTVNDIGYVMGGFPADYCNPLSTMSSYDPTTNKWTDRKSFSQRRGDFAYVTIGQYIYIIGGETKAAGCTLEKSTAIPVIDVERYDTATNEWIDYTPIAEKRFRFTAVVVKDKILDIGGQGDLVNNSWPIIADVYALNVTQYEINRTRTTPVPTPTPTPTSPPGGKNNDATKMSVSIITVVALIAAVFL